MARSISEYWSSSACVVDAQQETRLDKAIQTRSLKRAQVKTTDAVHKAFTFSRASRTLADEVTTIFTIGTRLLSLGASDFLRV